VVVISLDKKKSKVPMTNTNASRQDYGQTPVWQPGFRQLTTDQIKMRSTTVLQSSVTYYFNGSNPEVIHA